MFGILSAVCAAIGGWYMVLTKSETPEGKEIVKKSYADLAEKFDRVGLADLPYFLYTRISTWFNLKRVVIAEFFIKSSVAIKITITILVGIVLSIENAFTGSSKFFGLTFLIVFSSWYYFRKVEFLKTKQDLIKDKGAKKKKSEGALASYKVSQYNAVNTFTQIIFGSIISIAVFVLDKVYFLSNIDDATVYIGGNFLFDYYSIVFTVMLFVSFFRIRKVKFLGLYVFVDLFVASVLSLISISIIQWKYDFQFTFIESLCALFFIPYKGSSPLDFELFYTLHSSFIPTLLIIVFLIIIYTIKLLLLPILKRWKKASEVDHPYELIAQLWGFLFLVFGLFQVIVSYFDTK